MRSSDGRSVEDEMNNSSTESKAKEKDCERTIDPMKMTGSESVCIELNNLF